MNWVFLFSDDLVKIFEVVLVNGFLGLMELVRAIVCRMKTFTITD